MRAVFITGSSSGLGKALAEAFLKEGNAVFGISRNSTIQHKSYRHIHLDLSKPEEYKQFEFPSIKDFHEVVLINNAGSVQPVNLVGNIDFNDAVRTYHINILAPIFLIDQLAKKTSNDVVNSYVLNISSGAAQYPVEGWGIYCSTKSALDAFAEVVNKEMLNSRKNFIIRNICPGLIDTPIQKEIRSYKTERFPEVERFENYNKEGKLKSPEEVASKIMCNFNGFFASKKVKHSLA